MAVVSQEYMCGMAVFPVSGVCMIFGVNMISGIGTSVISIKYDFNFRFFMIIL